MVDAKKITDEQVGLLLSREEGHFIDFKAKEIKPAKLSQTLSALANADGGEVYVGVSEDKQKERFFGRDSTR